VTVTDDLVHLLRRVPLFASMTDAAYQHVAALTESQSVPAGRTITSQGEEGDAFYVIASGTADVRQGDRSIASLRPGDFFGEIALIDGRPRTATVVAAEDLVLLRIARDAFLRLIDEQPATRHGVLMALTQRIRRDAPNTTD
jgi:CRP/FNR family transcriptional regulator, cyclic AMP receptor protein